MKNNVYVKSVTNLVMTLVVAAIMLSQVGCTNIELADAVSKSVSVLVSPDGKYLVYGMAPNNQELFALVKQFGSTVQMYAGTTTPEGTVRMTTELAREGWKVVPWSAVPGAVQLAILARLQELAPLVGQVSVRVTAVYSPVMGLFYMPAVLLDGPKLPDGCKKINGNNINCDL
jgi:hypothetical protein